MSINTLISNNYYIFGFITFLLGLLIGNRLAIGRDKRKEFNAGTEAIYIKLLNQIKEINIGYLSAEITGFSYIRYHISVYRRWIFDIHVKKYQTAYNKYRQSSGYDTKTGIVSFDKSCVQNIKPYAKLLLSHPPKKK